MDTDRGAVSSYSLNSHKDLVPIQSESTLFETKNRRSKKIILVLAFLVLAFLATIIALAIIHWQPSSNYEICSSEECIRIAASLKETMNTSVDPCDDFYEYVCGKWSLEHPIPERSSDNSWYTEGTTRVLRRIRELLQKHIPDEAPWAVIDAVTLYDSCVDIEALDDLGLSPLKNLLEELNMPEIPAIFYGTPGNLTKQLVQLNRNLGKNVFFEFIISSDPRNNTRNILTVGVSSTTSPFPSKEYSNKKLPYLRNLRRSIVNEAVEDDDSSSSQQVYMKNVIREVVTNGTKQTCNSSSPEFVNETSIARVVAKLYRLSQKIDKLISDASEETSSEEDIKDEDYMYVDDLQKVTDDYVKSFGGSITPRKIWRPFIEELLIDYPDLDLTNNDKVLVKNLHYLKRVAFLMSISDDEMLEAIIWWNVLDTVAPHSSKNLRTAWNTYWYGDTGVGAWESRSLYCANAVNEMMGMAVAWLFVDQHFHQNVGPHITEMLDDVRTAFASIVMQADWMDNKTKLATLEKSKSMGSAIGYPDWLFGEGQLDAYYSGINVTTNVFLDNMVQIVKVKFANGLSVLNYENQENDTNSYWNTDPIDVNAFHNTQANAIVIPAGILQFPFYNLGLESLNYGAMGYTLGHELTHGFDNDGRRYDSFGNLRQWWTNETIRGYKMKTQCFVDHYNTYYEEEVDDHVDGELTLGENIADNGGVRQAIWAYKRWKYRHGAEATLPGFPHLSSEQLLFLAAGFSECGSYTVNSLKARLKDTHPPGRVRVTAVMRNSKEFSDAWKCPVGSKMNPETKCRLW